MLEYGIHPICDLFPRMPGEEFVALKKDIRENGLLEPIWLYEGKVLDGRHRHFACQEVGVEPRYRQYEGSNPLGFVISLNLNRRHLSESQRAMVAASLETMQHGGDRQSVKQDANLHLDRHQAAELLQVSPRSVATAAKVERDSTPEVIEAVKAGAMSLNLAAQVADLPAEEQAIVSEAPAGQIKEVAREVIHNHRALGTGENEWYTPEQHITAVREFFGEIDLDPASSDIAQQTVKAKQYFTIDDDGLSRDWAGRVWLNPPYSQPAIQQFIEKTIQECDNGHVEELILLTHNYTDTAWFHRAAGNSDAICFTRGRIGFLSPEGKKAAPTQGQAFFYFGQRRDEFADAFCRFGFVMERRTNNELC